MKLGPQTSLIFQTYIETDDDQGSTEKEWMDIATISGSLVSIKGDERFLTDRATLIKTHYFIINSQANFEISSEDRFVNTDDTKTYEIIDIMDLGNNKGADLQLTLLEKIK